MAALVTCTSIAHPLIQNIFLPSIANYKQARKLPGHCKTIVCAIKTVVMFRGVISVHAQEHCPEQFPGMVQELDCCKLALYVQPPSFQG